MENKREVAYKVIQDFCHQEGVATPDEYDLNEVCRALGRSDIVEAVKQMRARTSGTTPHNYNLPPNGGAFGAFLLNYGGISYEEVKPGLGLKDAKDVVDWLRVNQLELYA